MFPELGQACILVTVFFAFFNVLAPISLLSPRVKARLTEQQSNAIYHSVQRLALGQWFFLSLAIVALGISFINNDFSVSYVANHSNILLPTQYKISAIWGGHEGSLLLWVWILGLWTGLLALNRQNLPLALSASVLSMLGIVMLGFLFFILFTSNPFDRLLPDYPIDGQDLNPLLQDLGLIIHPPMLYMGYVGLAVPFAFAIAGLIHGEFNRQWAGWSRPWAKSAWAFLGLGIALGSWWAYYELGWGGWWFWDPVENASLMPWLAGAALLHSLLACEKREAFKVWTVLISIIAFSLSLLGTFLVRSGVLTSVHSFASDPARGLFILVFLGLVVGGSLLLFSFRAERLRTPVEFSLASREFLLMLNNIFLLVACATVLLGTLFPIISDVFNLGRVSIGPPYFNTLFLPLTVLLLICIAVVPQIKWRATHTNAQFNKTLIVSLLVSALLGAIILGLYQGFWDWLVFFMMTLCMWVLVIMLWTLNIFQFKGFLANWQKSSASHKNMHFAHLGLIVSIVGIVMTSGFSVEKDLSLGKGESVNIADYQFTFEGVERLRGPNYQTIQGLIIVKDKQGKAIELRPEKRQYLVQQKPMTEAAIDYSLFRDIYVALGEDLGNGKWSLRMYHKPFIRLIWLGAMIMGFSTLYYVFRSYLFPTPARVPLSKQTAKQAVKAGSSNRV